MAMKNPKRVFWEALLITVVVFVGGFILGIALEQSRFDKLGDYYAESEISLMDIVAFNNLNSGNLSCEQMISANVEFANRIYYEAMLLEKYEDSGKVTDEMKIAHKKYDVMRALLWFNLNEVAENCGSDFDLVVYLYENDADDLVIRATNSVWEKILRDVKEIQGDELILIPIAIDSGLVSVDSVAKDFNVTQYPALVINNKDVIYELNSAEDLENYLN